MIRIGLRLTLAGGREAIVRLVAIAAAVALGVGLLLTSLAGTHAVHTQSKRTAWLNTSKFNARPSANEASADPLWAAAVLDQYRKSVIERVDLAPTGPRSPVPPGIPHLPGPAQFYASPALTRLLASRPPAELADRFPGRQIGTIGKAALASPKSLVIVIGHTATELSAAGATQIRSFETAAQGAPGDAHPGRMQLILAVVAGALLIPVLLFIAAATRLAAARREQRFAAMRLVGATPGQVSVVAAVEASVAAVAGVALGFVLFFALRSLLATVPFTGQPFFRGDLAIDAFDVALVALGVPIAAAIAARIALRRVQISPLGVARRVTPPTPRAWRVIPLVAGVAELAYFVGRRPATTGDQIRAYGAGFLLIMGGLVLAGSWLTMVGSRLMARRARRAATLIAGRRLSDNPRAAFRAVSGLIVALFICSAALGIITTILAYGTASTGGLAGRNILTAPLVLFDESPNGTPETSGVLVNPALISTLRAIPGVRAVAQIHLDATPSTNQLGPPPGLISCADLESLGAFGHCGAGATVASIDFRDQGGDINPGQRVRAPAIRPAVATTLEVVRALPVAAIDVRTDGSGVAMERARTALEVAFPNAETPSTVGDISADKAQLVAGWRQLAEVAIVASLVIASCSLAVSVAAGLIDRKKPFSLLRLTGTSLGVLQRVVALEAAVPLLIVSVLAAGSGLLAAHLFLRSQLSESLKPPGAGYYVAVSAGLVFSLGIIAATLPLLRRITGPETARNE
jgi:FtsX-like permease family protein